MWEPRSRDDVLHPVHDLLHVHRAAALRRHHRRDLRRRCRQQRPNPQRLRGDARDLDRAIRRRDAARPLHGTHRDPAVLPAGPDGFPGGRDDHARRHAALPRVPADPDRLWAPRALHRRRQRARVQKVPGRPADDGLAHRGHDGQPLRRRRLLRRAGVRLGRDCRPVAAVQGGHAEALHLAVPGAPPQLDATLVARGIRQVGPGEQLRILRPRLEPGAARPWRCRREAPQLHRRGAPEHRRRDDHGGCRRRRPGDQRRREQQRRGRRRHEAGRRGLSKHAPGHFERRPRRERVHARVPVR
mmetsp:Transcript_19240/g.59763  ORF Transcript_19240/g.59763 Transcript_19240/m.59763 type:complete len:300 (-) Transcript_19240:481-1380(-)